MARALLRTDHGAIRESRRDRLEEKEARAKLQEAELCEGVDLSKFRDEKKGSGVIVFKGTECVEVRPVLNVFKWSTERVAEMNENKQGFGPMAQQLWQEEIRAKNWIRFQKVLPHRTV